MQRLEQSSLRESIHPITSDNSAKAEEAAAALIRHLLADNKHMNVKLRKVKDELLLIKELCSSCSTCIQEKKLKKLAATNLRQRSMASPASEVIDSRSSPLFSECEI